MISSSFLWPAMISSGSYTDFSTTSKFAEIAFAENDHIYHTTEVNINYPIKSKDINQLWYVGLKVSIRTVKPYFHYTVLYFSKYRQLFRCEWESGGNPPMSPSPGNKAFVRLIEGAW